MNINKYQDEATKLAVYPDDVWDSYLPLQLASEAGEVAAEFAKPQRKGTSYDYTAIALELGDVMWYAANLASKINMRLEDILDMNITKLKKRYGDKNK